MSFTRRSDEPIEHDTDLFSAEYCLRVGQLNENVAVVSGILFQTPPDGYDEHPPFLKSSERPHPFKNTLFNIDFIHLIASPPEAIPRHLRGKKQFR